MKIQLPSKTSYQLPTFQEISKNCQLRFKDLRNAVNDKLNKTSFDKDALIKTAKENQLLFSAAAVATAVMPFAAYPLFSGSSEEPCVNPNATSTNVSKSDNGTLTPDNGTLTPDNGTNEAISTRTSYNFTDFSTMTSDGTVAVGIVSTIVIGLAAFLCIKKCNSKSSNVSKDAYREALSRTLDHPEAQEHARQLQQSRKEQPIEQRKERLEIHPLSLQNIFNSNELLRDKLVAVANLNILGESQKAFRDYLFELYNNSADDCQIFFKDFIANEFLEKDLLIQDLLIQLSMFIGPNLACFKEGSYEYNLFIRDCTNCLFSNLPDEFFDNKDGQDQPTKINTFLAENFFIEIYQERVNQEKAAIANKCNGGEKPILPATLMAQEEELRQQQQQQQQQNTLQSKVNNINVKTIQDGGAFNSSGSPRLFNILTSRPRIEELDFSTPGDNEPTAKPEEEPTAEPKPLEPLPLSSTSNTQAFFELLESDAEGEEGDDLTIAENDAASEKPISENAQEMFS